MEQPLPKLAFIVSLSNCLIIKFAKEDTCDLPRAYWQYFCVLLYY